MTDAKLQALAQALHFHNSTFGSHPEVGKAKTTADQIIATAKKFEAFLDPNSRRK